MLTAAHTIIYTADAQATRAFFRDVLGFPAVDAGGGWLIFALPPGELGVHPSDASGPQYSPGRHELYLMCDDIEKTVAELTAKGVEFTRPVAQMGWGALTAFKLPGAGEMCLYQPHHPTAHDLKPKATV
jgi:catechol 2,3-dioxygenase-like lactoylglutathione lyase family enzyme